MYKTLAQIEKNAIEDSFIRNGYNKTKTAKELGISRTAFYRKAKKHGITLDTIYQREDGPTQKSNGRDDNRPAGKSRNNRGNKDPVEEWLENR